MRVRRYRCSFIEVKYGAAGRNDAQWSAAVPMSGTTSSRQIATTDWRAEHVCVQASDENTICIQVMRHRSAVNSILSTGWVQPQDTPMVRYGVPRRDALGLRFAAKASVWLSRPRRTCTQATARPLRALRTYVVKACMSSMVRGKVWCGKVGRY